MIPGNHDECTDQDEITQSLGLEHFGIYNSLPEPAREIASNTYVKHVVRETIVGIETRQPVDLHYATLRIHWLDPGNGVGISRCWLDGDIVNRFWFFGCEHVYTVREPTQAQRDLMGDCAHVHICVHCGHEVLVDSSG